MRLFDPSVLVLGVAAAVAYSMAAGGAPSARSAERALHAAAGPAAPRYPLLAVRFEPRREAEAPGRDAWDLRADALRDGGGMRRYGAR